jgi:hypothetical protein
MQSFFRLGWPFPPLQLPEEKPPDKVSTRSAVKVMQIMMAAHNLRQGWRREDKK